MKTVLTATIAALALGLAGPALAEYPEKPVTFIVPWPPGDLEDVLTRMIAEDFQTEYGVAAAAAAARSPVPLTWPPPRRTVTPSGLSCPPCPWSATRSTFPN